MAFLEKDGAETVSVGIDGKQKTVWDKTKDWIYPQADYQNRLPYSI